MSIPWRGLPPQHVVELATAALAFLTPCALVLISKTITRIARKIRQRAQPSPDRLSPCSDVLHFSQEVCHVYPEGEHLVLKKDERRLQQDLFRELDVNQNEDQEDLRGDYNIVHHESLYCLCGSLGDTLALSKGKLDKGKRGGCGEFAPMELPHSDICLREKAKLGETEQKRSLDALKSNKSTRVRELNPRDPNKSKDQARGQQKLDADRSRTEEDYQALLDELKHSINDPTKTYQLEARLSGKTKETNYLMELPEPADPALNFALQKPEAVPEESTSPRDYLNCPRNQTLSTRNRPNVEETHEQSEASELDCQESQTVVADDSGLGVNDSESDDRSKETADDEECNHGVTEVCAQEDSDPSMDVAMEPEPDIAVTNDLSQAISQDDNLAVENGTNESAAEPHGALSRSSSCDSFSTANCSNRASAIRLNADCPRPSENEEEYYQMTRSENKDRPGHRRETRYRHGCMARQLSEQQSAETNPIFKLVTPPPLFYNSQDKLPMKYRSRSPESQDSQSQDSQYSQSQDSQSQDSQSQDSRATEDSESDTTDDSTGLNDDSQTEDEKEEPQNFTQWLSSVLKSLLPAFQKKQAQSKKKSKKPRKRNDLFESFDVRNVLNRQLHNMAAPDTKACPHSCVSSLCNFRRTLESWKKQLLAMHTALDASSAVLPEKPCIYCREDRPSGSHHQCQTMQIAQVFWRTVLQFKRSHLEPSNCPHVSKPRSDTTTSTEPEAVDSEECALGHRHSCNSDYSGCIQQSNAPALEANMNEAPCVHVLLEDVDTLLQRLENIKETYSGNESQRKSKPGEGNADDRGRCSEGKSTGSIISPSPSISLTEELGELEELADSILDEYDQSSDDECSYKDFERVRQLPDDLSQGGLVAKPASRNKEGEKVPDHSANDTSSQESTTKEEEEEDPPPSIASAESSLTRVRELCKSAEGSSSPVFMSEQLIISKTKMLGKFALRYLEHIEDKLDSDDLALEAPSPERESPKPSSGGDTPKPMPRTLLRENSGAQAHSKEVAATLQKKLSDALMSQFPSLPVTDSSSDKAEEAQHASSSADPERKRDETSPAGVSREVRREPSLVSAFRDIIADLDRLHAGKPVARHKTAGKNVKFALPCVQKSRSLTSASPTNMNSPPLRPAALSSSSCTSLTASREDLQQKNREDLSVNEAFDLLDKVVDELLQLMNAEKPR
ncbi:uro-adherence factor A-like [Littorina saxatilis]|uniref:Uncharacterized protein n=1 Tax=Littorina saxatilis TaxID=31220 RepID=A0AAN9C3H2_9CAEN